VGSQHPAHHLDPCMGARRTGLHSWAQLGSPYLVRGVVASVCQLRRGLHAYCVVHHVSEDAQLHHYPSVPQVRRQHSVRLCEACFHRVNLCSNCGDDVELPPAPHVGRHHYGAYLHDALWEGLRHNPLRCRRCSRPTASPHRRSQLRVVGCSRSCRPLL